MAQQGDVQGRPLEERLEKDNRREKQKKQLVESHMSLKVRGLQRVPLDCMVGDCGGEDERKWTQSCG